MNEPALYVRKPLKLVFSKQTYTALEMDINTVFLAHLPNEKEGSEWPEDKEFKVSFYVKEHLKESSWRKIKTALSGLNSKRVEVIDDNGQECIFSSIYPETKLQDGIITLYMRGKYIKDYTKLTAGYGGWFLKEYMRLSRDVQKILFEMFCTAVNKRINRLEFEIKGLKEDLGIADQYIYRNKECYERSIIPAVDVINERTSLKATPAMQRKGRQTFIMFLVERKETDQPEPTQEPIKESQEQKPLPKDPNDTRPQKCYDYLIKYGFAKKAANNCASNPRTMKLFFQWHTTTKPDYDKGIKTPTDMQKSFYGELKKNDLKI